MLLEMAQDCGGEGRREQGAEDQGREGTQTVGRHRCCAATPLSAALPWPQLPFLSALSSGSKAGPVPY